MRKKLVSWEILLKSCLNSPEEKVISDVNVTQAQDENTKN